VKYIISEAVVRETEKLVGGLDDNPTLHDTIENTYQRQLRMLSTIRRMAYSLAAAEAILIQFGAEAEQLGMVKDILEKGKESVHFGSVLGRKTVGQDNQTD
jgi:hypothetical protein